MKHKSIFRSFPYLVTASVLLSIIFGLFGGSSPATAETNAFGEEIAAVPVTVITVDSGTDPDNSKSKTCLSDTPCTFRRAIVQARALGVSSRPALIQFDIPATSAEGYDSAKGIWKIDILTTSDTSVFRYLDGGQVEIDGTTQTGGRASGPKIFIVGPGTGSKDGLKVGSSNFGTDDDNVVRGLAFQNFKTHLTINSNGNLVEGNWFGLNDEGTAPYLREDDPQDGSGSAGVALSANVVDNVIQDNVFLGFDGVSAALRGDGNTFSDNYVGTNASGNVPGKQTDPSLICTPVDWLGGGGISMEGDDHVIEDNIFAGLRQEIFHTSTQPSAIRVTGTGHQISNNQIGVDEADNEVGVCGRGIYLSDSPRGLMVSDNNIVNPGLSGISMNGKLYDANELRTNTIKMESPWPEVQGNPKPENAIQVGPGLPAAFQSFMPAKVTEINGTEVSGTSGDNSPCPNCKIEVFLDDIDAITETLQSLAVVTANSSGNWAATLPFELASDQGLRTTSTTAQYNTIPLISAGTTTKLSGLYGAGGRVIYLPLVINNK